MQTFGLFWGNFKGEKRDISIERQVSLHQKLTNSGLTRVSPLTCISSFQCGLCHVARTTAAYPDTCATCLHAPHIKP